MDEKNEDDRKKDGSIQMLAGGRRKKQGHSGKVQA